jgi:biopolymer transport protein ExbD
MRAHLHEPPDEEADEELPLAPLIDAVFLLLIFFLVSTMIKQVNRDIDIDLPESAAAERLTPRADSRVVGIDSDGMLHFEGEPVSLHTLHTAIRGLGLLTEPPMIRLDVDRAAPTHRVVEVLDLCRFNGLREVGIRTYDEFYNR